jgi:hypothetical protein
MADLTPDEISYIRFNIGDTNISSPRLSDTYLEYLFDNKADSDVDKTIVWALRSLLGGAADEVQQSNQRTGDSKSRQQYFEHLQSLLKKWEGITGEIGSLVTTGTINLGIDEEDQNFDIS